MIDLLTERTIELIAKNFRNEFPMEDQELVGEIVDAQIVPSLGLVVLLDVHVELVGEVDGTLPTICGRLNACVLLHQLPVVLVDGVHVDGAIEQIVHHLGVHIVQRNVEHSVDTLETQKIS